MKKQREFMFDVLDSGRKIAGTFHVWYTVVLNESGHAIGVEITKASITEYNSAFSWSMLDCLKVISPELVEEFYYAAKNNADSEFGFEESFSEMAAMIVNA